MVEMRASLEAIERGGGVESAASFCRNFKTDVIKGLGIPDENDYEVRVTRDDEVDLPVINCDLTEGPNEYPDYEKQEAFFPSSKRLDEVGKKIQVEANNSPFGVEKTYLTVWPNTTFLLQEEDSVDDPLVPEELEKLQSEVRQMITEAQVKLVVSPEQITSGSTSKEGEFQRKTELIENEVVKISDMIAETLGITPELMREPKFEVVRVADTPFSLEFDSKTKDGNSMPEVIRQYVAEKALFSLHKRFNTKREQLEVWIRQNRPEPWIYTSESSFEKQGLVLRQVGNFFQFVS